MYLKYKAAGVLPLPHSVLLQMDRATLEIIGVNQPLSNAGFFVLFFSNLISTCVSFPKLNLCNQILHIH